MATLKRFIIHELSRLNDPDIAEKLLDINITVIANLANDLIKIKDDRTAVLWGKFRASSPFPTELTDLYEKTSLVDFDNSFIKLTESCMWRLNGEIKHTNSKGGYICFVEYLSKGRTRLLIAMINNTSGVKLKKLTPEDDVHVDKSKLHQAVDISISAYIESFKQNDPKNYLSFIGKGKETEYFSNAFNCEEKIVQSKMPAKVLDISKEYLQFHGAGEVAQKTAREQIINYFKENEDKEVFTSKIEKILDACLPTELPEESKKTFIKFCNEKNYQMPSSFLAQKGAVSRLNNINYVTDDFKFNTVADSIGLWGVESHRDKSVLYNPDNDDLLLKGKNMPPKIKDAIMQYFNSPMESGKK